MKALLISLKQNAIAKSFFIFLKSSEIDLSFIAKPFCILMLIGFIVYIYIN